MADAAPDFDKMFASKDDPHAKGPDFDKMFAPKATTKDLVGDALINTADSALFGYGKDVAGGIAHLAGGSYDDTKRHIAEREERLHREAPVSAFASDALGALPTLALPLGNLGRAGRIADALTPIGNFQRATAAPSLVAGAGEAALGGIKFGALTRGSNYDTSKGGDNSVLARAERAVPLDDPGEMAKHAMVDSAMGIGGQAVGAGIGRAAGALHDSAMTSFAGIRDFLRTSSGENRVADRIMRDLPGHDNLDAIRDLVYPEINSGHLAATNQTPRQYGENLLDAYHGEMHANGGDDTAARLAVRNRFAQQSGVAPAWVTRHLNSALDQHATTNAFPAQLNELVAMARGGEAPNTHSQFGYLVNRPESEAAGNVIGNMDARAASQGEVVPQILDRRLGNGDIHQTLRENQDRISAANEPYEQLHANETPQNREALQREISAVNDHYNRQIAGDQSSYGKGIEDAVATMSRRFREPMNGYEPPLPDGSGVPAAQAQLEASSAARYAVPKGQGVAPTAYRDFTDALQTRLTADPEFHQMVQSLPKDLNSIQKKAAVKVFLDQKGVQLPKEFLSDQFGPRHAEAAFDAIEHPNYANDGIMGPLQVGPPRNLQEFIRKKSALWGLATKAERDGNAPLARTIKGYYHELNDAAERGYPEYRPVNDRAADARAIDQAQVAGEKFPMQKDRKQALAVQQVSKLSPDEQQGFRQGLSTNIQTQLGRMGARHNAGKAFDKNQFRDMLQTLEDRNVLPAGTSEEIGNLGTRLGLATRSFQANKGSITSRNLFENENATAMAKAMAFVQSIPQSTVGVLKHVASHFAAAAEGEAKRAVNERAIGLYGAHTGDLVDFSRTLRTLEAAMHELHAGTGGPAIHSRIIDALGQLSSPRFRQFTGSGVAEAGDKRISDTTN